MYMRKVFIFSLILLTLSYAQSPDRQLLEFESQLQKQGLKYKSKRLSGEAVYAHRNVTLRLWFNHRVNVLSAWIVPRRDYRDNLQTLDFLSSAVRTFCGADQKEVQAFREVVAYNISHTRSAPVKVGKCSGELRHITEFMSWELLLTVRE